MLVLRFLPFVLAGLICRAALANDSSAELATGGLNFTKNPDIEMRSEELNISSRQITVRYRFYNRSPKAVTTLVAFPMPDIGVDDSDANISVPTEDAENLLGFSTVVNGAPVKARIEQRAFAGSVERTADLRKLGIPLAPHLAATDAAISRLAPQAIGTLTKLGLIEAEEYDSGKGMQKHFSPRWTLKTSYFWEQTFPAGAETAIEHRYKPSVGVTSQTAIGEPGMNGQKWFRDYQRKYCMDRDFLGAAERSRRSGKAATGRPFSEERISYLLTTGTNWSGPIGQFRLIIDKGDPANLLSTCTQGLKRISPTKFELVKANFVPKTELHILILKQLKPGF